MNYVAFVIAVVHCIAIVLHSKAHRVIPFIFVALKRLQFGSGLADWCNVMQCNVKHEFI